MKGFTEFNHVVIDGTIKKAYYSNNNTISKKETQLLLITMKDTYLVLKSLKKLHKSAKRILEKKDMG